MAEPKIDPNWNRKDHIRIRPFLVAGIPISLIIIAIVLTFFQQSRELGKQGAKEAFNLSKVEICPKQLGPNKLMPASNHFFAIAISKSL